MQIQGQVTGTFPTISVKNGVHIIKSKSNPMLYWQVGLNFSHSPKTSKKVTELSQEGGKACSGRAGVYGSPGVQELESVLTQNCHAAPTALGPLTRLDQLSCLPGSRALLEEFWIKDCWFSIYQLERTETRSQMAKTSSSARKGQWQHRLRLQNHSLEKDYSQLCSKLTYKVKHKAGTITPMQVFLPCLSDKMSSQRKNKTSPRTLPSMFCVHSFFFPKTKKGMEQFRLLILSGKSSSHLWACSTKGLLGGLFFYVKYTSITTNTTCFQCQ